MFIYDALRDRPVGLFSMDDTSPFQDYSGYGRNAVVSSGTPPKHPSFVSGCEFSQVFSNTSKASFDSPVFVAGTLTQDFSIEAWVRKIDGTTSAQQILGHNGQMDGLVIAGTTASFILKFSDGSQSSVVFDFQENQSLHLVGTKTKDSISFFVNGVLVGSTDIPDNLDLALSGSSVTSLFSGEGAGSLALGGIGLYSSVLNEQTVMRHYQSGSNMPTVGDIAATFGGTLIVTSLNENSLFQDRWWRTRDDWEQGEKSNVVIFNDSLVPDVDNETSLPGVWKTSFALDSTEATSIYGVQLNWEAVGATVEVSLDGETWVVAERTKNVSLIPSGLNPTNKELQIRVSFAGGIENDESYFDNLNAVGILTGTSNFEGRTITLNQAYQERGHSSQKLNENCGTEILAGGGLTISADTSDEPVATRTLELWVKPYVGAGQPSISFTGTRYQNGYANSNNLPEGQWTLLHIVAASDVTTSISVSGRCQVGSVTLYPTALSAGTVENIYRRYNATNTTKWVEDDTISLPNAAQDSKIYAQDWSILGAG